MTKFDEIVSLYAACGSMKQVARELEVSHSVVKRVLITADAIIDERIELANQMHKSGASVDEIAEKLCIKPKTVFNYLPYNSTCRCDWADTINAQRIRECRERKKNVTP